MIVSYEPTHDVAYVNLTGDALARVASTEEVVRGKLFLDFDAGGRLIGIEALAASTILPADVLAAAEGEACESS